MVGEITLVSLNVSLKRKLVREIASGYLAVNSIHLSKCLSKNKVLISLKLERYTKL